MWNFIWLFLFSILSAEDIESFRPSFTVNGEHFPIANIEGEPSSIVGGCVNVITGDFVDMSQDFVISGSLPLTIERSYSSSDSSRGYLSNSWHLNVGGVAAMALKEDVMGWKGLHGRELSFVHTKHSSKNVYDFDHKILHKGVTNNSTGLISGKTNIKNCFIRMKNSKKHHLTVYTGDGSESFPGTFEICPICNWEDDPVQLMDPEFKGGANEESLNEARKNFRIYKASVQKYIDDVSAPLDSEIPFAE